VFKSSVLRKILGPEKEAMTGNWRKLLNEELHDLYSSPNIIRVIKEDEIGGACSTNGGKGIVHTGFWLENLRERDHLEDPGMDGRIILKWLMNR
jgi:hypothetical protein